MAWSNLGRLLAVACAAAAAGGVHAQDAAPLVPAAKLAAGLPATAWGDTTREAPVLLNETTPFRRSVAKATFKGPRGSTEPFVAVLSIGDDGASNAKMYGYVAKYMKEDVKTSSEHSIKLAGGRRAQVTEYTARSLDVETFVADRFVVRASCMESSEADCINAFSKFDFKAIEALKP